MMVGNLRILFRVIIMICGYFPDIFVTGTGTRVSVSVSAGGVVNDSHVIIDVIQAEPDDSEDLDCPPGQFMETQQIKGHLRKRRTGSRLIMNVKRSVKLKRQEHATACRPCSVCPDSYDIIIITPCSSTQDTQCGICTGFENRTCTSMIDITASVIPESVMNKKVMDTTMSTAQHELIGGQFDSSHLTLVDSDLSEKSGDTAEFIGALVTAALSLVMFIVLIVTGPVVIYLKIRDWLQYGRRPSQDHTDNVENGRESNCYCLSCLSLKPCHDVVPPPAHPSIPDAQVCTPHTTCNARTSYSLCNEGDSLACAEEISSACDVEQTINTGDGEQTNRNSMTLSDVMISPPRHTCAAEHWSACEVEQTYRNSMTLSDVMISPSRHPCAAEHRSACEVEQTYRNTMTLSDVMISPSRQACAAETRSACEVEETNRNSLPLSDVMISPPRHSCAAEHRSACEVEQTNRNSMTLSDVMISPSRQPCAAETRSACEVEQTYRNSMTLSDVMISPSRHPCAAETRSACEVEQKPHNSVTSSDVKDLSSAIEKFDEIPNVGLPLCYDDSIDSNHIGLLAEHYQDVVNGRFDTHPKEMSVLLPSGVTPSSKTIPENATLEESDTLLKGPTGSVV